jgi:hypothetical protein
MISAGVTIMLADVRHHQPQPRQTRGVAALVNEASEIADSLNPIGCQLRQSVPLASA